MTEVASECLTDSVQPGLVSASIRYENVDVPSYGEQLAGLHSYGTAVTISSASTMSGLHLTPRATYRLISPTRLILRCRSKSSFMAPRICDRLAAFPDDSAESFPNLTRVLPDEGKIVRASIRPAASSEPALYNARASFSASGPWSASTAPCKRFSSRFGCRPYLILPFLLRSGWP